MMSKAIVYVNPETLIRLSRCEESRKFHRMTTLSQTIIPSRLNWGCRRQKALPCFLRFSNLSKYTSQFYGADNCEQSTLSCENALRLVSVIARGQAHYLAPCSFLTGNHRATRIVNSSSFVGIDFTLVWLFPDFFQDAEALLVANVCAKKESGGRKFSYSL